MMMIKYFQGYGQIKETFRALKKDDIPTLCISDLDFRSTVVDGAGEDNKSVVYNSYVFDTCY